MKVSEETGIKHLLSRATFGQSPVDAKSTLAKTIRDLTRNTATQQIDKFPKPENLRKLRANMQPGETRNRNLPRERKKEILMKSRQNMMLLNLQWLDNIATSTNPLQEKMTLFWHDHFSCRTAIPFFGQQQYNTLQKNALGDFKTMLMSISKDAAMLQFLNNQQNRKDHPNENFAREVMELFTLGRGNYTEHDIKEAARAFTGWGFNRSGEFVFREKHHDNQAKDFRGTQRKFTGEQIIDAILDDRKTALFITTKLAKYFVGENLTENPTLIELSESFYNTNYDIRKLVASMLSSDLFYSENYIGNRIKTPVELIIGAQLHTESKFEDSQSLIFFQRALGQLLLYPPNVGGWPKGKGWIDSSSLSFRLSMPTLLFTKQETDFAAKDDGDVNSLRENKLRRNFSLTVDWQKLATKFSRNTTDQTYAAIENSLLIKPTSVENKKFILSMTSSNEPEQVKNIFTGIMSLPEYQLS